MFWLPLATPKPSASFLPRRPPPTAKRPLLPKVETMVPEPISPYGVTKFVGEIYGQVFGRVYGLENVSLRYFNVFGPRQDPTSQYSGVLSRFMLALLDGKQPVVFGDGEQSRDFTYVANVVDLTLRACEAPGASGKVFNGGTGARITLNQVLKLLEKISGKSAKAKYDPPRTGDILHSQADITKRKKCWATNRQRRFRRRPEAHLGVVQAELRQEVIAKNPPG